MSPVPQLTNSGCSGGRRGGSAAAAAARRPRARCNAAHAARLCRAAHALHMLLSVTSTTVHSNYFREGSPAGSRRSSDRIVLSSDFAKGLL